MEKLKAFQDVARTNGFVDVEETDDGTVLWLKKPTANAEDRMCVDSLTNSVTVFWATMPWKINSKTFRAVSALQEWFTLTSRQAASMTNRDALLRLSADKNDAPAMAALCQNNAELLRASIARFFESGDGLREGTIRSHATRCRARSLLPHRSRARPMARQVPQLRMRPRPQRSHPSQSQQSVRLCSRAIAPCSRDRRKPPEGGFTLTD